MFAGAEPVRGEVGALAGRRASFESTEFDLVDPAAGRENFEVGEDAVGFVQVGDPKPFLTCAEPATQDFILIRGPPISGGWKSVS